MKLTVEDLSKQYRRDFLGLRDIDLELGPGVTGLLGPNGACLEKFSVTIENDLPLVFSGRSFFIPRRHIWYIKDLTGAGQI